MGGVDWVALQAGVAGQGVRSCRGESHHAYINHVPNVARLMSVDARGVVTVSCLRFMQWQGGVEIDGHSSNSQIFH